MFTEDQIEQYALQLLEDLGYKRFYGPALAPDGEFPERANYADVLLEERLTRAIASINSNVSETLRQQALQIFLRAVRTGTTDDLLTRNETLYTYLTNGIRVTYTENGQERGTEVYLIDYEHPGRNEFMAVNQLTVKERHYTKRPDIVLYVNGIPLVVIELKNPADDAANVLAAYRQIETYKATIPTLFVPNVFAVLSDGLDARAGTLSADFERFMAWKSADGTTEASPYIGQLETLIKGMLRPPVLLDLLRSFVVFEKVKTERIDAEGRSITSIRTVKKLAAYHQYYAVNAAVERTQAASSHTGDRKAGVVWHTQGSGKSLSMVFYTGKLVQRLSNPTVVVITDRNDLDDQLFETFGGAAQLLGQPPQQARDRAHLKELLRVASGGVVFTTIQKFLPELADTADDQPQTTARKTTFDQLSDRRNIVVIADEAHRTQYGFRARMVDVRDADRNVVGQQIAYGFAKYLRDALPNATYIGFTGTPIESGDVNTPALFGQYIDIYDIGRAVADGATVPIYYESRLAHVKLTDEGRQLVEEVDNDEQMAGSLAGGKAITKWSRLEAIIGTPERLRNLARDLVDHYEKRQAVFEGKAMIVAMSRRIAVDLYHEIVTLRPNWHHPDLDKGTLKVVITAQSSDGDRLAVHHTSTAQRRSLSARMKDETDALKLVIVVDMWLTGFDVPSLHTMYLDKPMQGHTLMQTIARVNRVFKDKPGGLIVDYLGIASDLKKALAFYSEAGGKGDPALTQASALVLFREKLEVVRQLYHGFEYQLFFTASVSEKLSYILRAEEHILSLDKGKDRYFKEVAALSRTFALATPEPEVLQHTDEVGFFQAVRARLAKFDTTGPSGKADASVETAVKQVVDKALVSDKVIDIFDAAGIKKPDISILSEEFLLEVKDMKHKNVAIELLRKILNEELKTRSKKNLTLSRSLLERLETSILNYQNKLLTTAEVVQELITLAKDINAADKRGDTLNLSSDELSFYDALETNDTAVKVLGDHALRDIARELTEKVRNNATIDWNLKESTRAKLMVLVRRTLNKYGYPPDKQAKAIETVMKQAESLADYWTN